MNICLLSLLYDTGARVQELVDITIQDIQLNPPAQIWLTGKGRKTRIVPLMSGTVKPIDPIYVRAPPGLRRVHKFTIIF